MHQELINLAGVVVDPINPLEVSRPLDLIRILLLDYNAKDSESPCSGLDKLHSYPLSVSSTAGAEPTTSLVRFQSLDKECPDLLHYKCHLKGKATFRNLANNENNMVAASWKLHQMMDGMNTAERIPLVAISIKTASNERSAAHDNRYAVTLSLEFFNETSAMAFAATDQAKKVDKTRWETCVYVMDLALFKECVEWKAKDTAGKWQEHKDLLERE
jgi:hypothetical protein